MAKKKKQTTGRPPIVDENVIRKLEFAFSMGCTDLEACLQAGISKSTLYNYQGDNPSFLDRKDLLRESLVLKARKTVHDAIDAGDKETSKWYLERKKKDEFSTKSEAAIDQNITVNIVNGLGD